MRQLFNFCLAIGAALSTTMAFGDVPECIKGMYVEIRGNASEYAYAARVDSSSSQTDDCAVLAWKVTKGSFDGVSLDGLAVVAVLQPNAQTGPGTPLTRTRLLVDSCAQTDQRESLVALAKRLAGDVLGDVASLDTEEIDLRIGDGCAHGYAWLDSTSVRARTRPMDKHDWTQVPEARRQQTPLAESYYAYRAATVNCTCAERNAEWPLLSMTQDVSFSALVGGFWIDHPASVLGPPGVDLAMSRRTCPPGVWVGESAVAWIVWCAAVNVELARQ